MHQTVPEVLKHVVLCEGAICREGQVYLAGGGAGVRQVRTVLGGEGEGGGRGIGEGGVAGLRGGGHGAERREGTRGGGRKVRQRWTGDGREGGKEGGKEGGEEGGERG